MKKFLKLKIVLLTLLFSIQVVAQKEDYNWLLSRQRKHIDFNTNPATITTIPNNNLEMISEYNASISTPNGDLIFYTDGNHVFTKDHTVMPNGNDIKNFIYTRYTVIVPKPGSCTEYYVISSGLSCVNFNEYYVNTGCVTQIEGYNEYGKDEGLKYSIVNMDDNGDNIYNPANELGYVVANHKKISIPEPTGNTAITIVRHANGTDYWLIAADAFTDKFHVYQIKSTGIFPAESPYYEQHIGSDFNIEMLTQLKSNNQGNKLATVSYFPTLANMSYRNYPFLLDFDNNTGKISNPIIISNNPFRECIETNSPCLYAGISSFEFSPDDSQLYINDADGIVQVQVLPTIQNAQLLAGYDLIPNVYVSYNNIIMTPESPARILVEMVKENPYELLPKAVINNPNVGGSSNIELNAFPLIGNPINQRFVEGGGVWQQNTNCQQLETSENILENKSIVIYPNPVEDWLTLRMKNKETIENIKVFNLNGLLVLEAKISSSKVNVKTLPKGIYIVVVKTSEGEFREKIVKK